ncbi:MAG TPA: DUF5336 domain-containing protein [Pseudonocardiaceae bacterium]
MSVPYGQPPAAPQPGPAGSPAAGLSLGKILALAAGGLGLVIYFLSFTDGAGVYLRGLLGVLLVGGGLLVAASALPKPQATLLAGTVPVVTGTLFLLIDVTSGPTPFGAISLGPISLAPSGTAQTSGLAVVALILAFLQSITGVAALLLEAGLVSMAPRRARIPQGAWGPPQPGGGYPMPPPGQGGYPGQPGQPGQPAGPAPGVFPPAPQQYPYLDQTVQYRNPPGQYGGAPPGQYGIEPGLYGGGEPPPYRGEPGQYRAGEPGRHGGEPADQPDQPGPPGQQDRPGPPGQQGQRPPGGTPGGFGSPGQG